MNNYQYQINNNKYDDHETIKYISEDYIAHTSTLDNDIFLNISPVDSEKKTYFIYKIIFQGSDTLRLMEVTSRIREKFNSSDRFKCRTYYVLQFSIFS